MRASEPGAKTHTVEGGRVWRYGLRSFALGYLGLLLIIPVGLIFFKAFEDGVMHALESVTTPDALHAFYLTIVLVLIAVPLNTIFGIACAIVLVRHNFRGKAILNALIDLPFAVSSTAASTAGSAPGSRTTAYR
jgi:sulfate transport system permease protein